jgi:WD40 repeat protein
MIASSGDEEIIRLWDIENNQHNKILQGHTDRIRSLLFNFKGDIIASGSDDGTIKLWSVSTLECINTLIPDKPYSKMNITDVEGLTETQKTTLKELGAIED